MKTPELFATFGYRHQLVDLCGKKALKSTRSTKLSNGLMIGLVNPKYLTGGRSFLKVQSKKLKADAFTKVRDEIYRLCRELIKLDEPWKFVVI
jgi:hypothetical protein